jgi:hypothetical protein
MQPDARSSPDRPEPSTYDLALDSGERCDWRAAHALLAAADTRGDLDPRGLELLAESARWIGRDDAIIDPLERAHAAYTRDRDTAGAARTALALLHANIDHARDDVAATWLHRAEDLLASLPEGREHALLACSPGTEPAPAARAAPSKSSSGTRGKRSRWRCSTATGASSRWR